jgi:membrane-associated phospholipid phosphatase
MVLLTWFGDGLFMVLIGMFLLFIKLRYGLIILSSFLASSLFVQLLKRLVFPEFKRPVAWFQDLGIEIYRVVGIEYHSAFSFPSGHTTTAFALFFGLAFFIKNFWLKIVFLLLAVITGYSRIYLSQHFLGDALAGSILGVSIAIIMQSVFNRIETEWMDKNVVSLIRKKYESS